RCRERQVVRPDATAGQTARARELGEAELVAPEQIRVLFAQAARRLRSQKGGECVPERATDRDAGEPTVGNRGPSGARENLTEPRGPWRGTLEVGVNLQLAGRTRTIAGSGQLRQVETRRLDMGRETRVRSRAGEAHAAVRGAAEEMDVPPLEPD